MTRHKGKTPLEANDSVGSRVWLTGDARGASSHRRPPFPGEAPQRGTITKNGDPRILKLQSTIQRPRCDHPANHRWWGRCRATDNGSLASFTHNGANKGTSYHCGATGQRRPKHSRGVTYRVRTQSIRGPSGAVRQAFRRLCPEGTRGFPEGRRGAAALKTCLASRGQGILTSKDAKRYRAIFIKKFPPVRLRFSPPLAWGPRGTPQAIHSNNLKRSLNFYGSYINK